MRRRNKFKQDRLEEKNNKKRGKRIPSETKQSILGVFVFTFATICFLSLLDLAGTAGSFLSSGLKYFFGLGVWLFPFVLFFCGYFIFRSLRQPYRSHHYFGLSLFVLSYSGLFQLIIGKWKEGSEILFGGYLGYFIARPLERVMGFWAGSIILFALLIISILLILETSFDRLINKNIETVLSKISSSFKEKMGRAETDNFTKEEIREEVEIKDRKKETNGKIFPLSKKEGEKKISLSEEIYQRRIGFPLDLLDKAGAKPVSLGDINTNKDIIRRTLENFAIPVEMGEVSIGPTVTQYTLRPSEGVKLSQITTLHNDLALALAAHPIRIEAPIPGKSLVGIEVPNKSIARVSLREILESDSFKKRKSNLSIALGKDVAGNPYFAYLDRMPHLLVAGATGSGKTVCLNSIIISLLYQNSPHDLKFILIDPKRVELSVYEGIAHLLTPVIIDSGKTINALKWSISEMGKRFDLLAQAGKRDIYDYNRTEKEKLPYIIIVVDELADLMVASPIEVETCIIRLAQLSRAVGIHLIMATQRPSVDIITGLIKANITSRIAFSVASSTDSRTILDVSGAEKLLGRGDMLYISTHLSKPLRLQGAFVSDEAAKSVVDNLKNGGGPEYLSEVVESERGGTVFSGFTESDELLPKAKEMVLQTGKASASFLQRRLRIGYARAARLLDLLEEEGVIGPGDGAKPRKVLKEEEGFLENDFEEEEGQEKDEEENKEDEI